MTKKANQPEPEHFQLAWLNYPGHEVMRRDLALAEFRELTPAKQKLCRAAVPEYAGVLVRYGRKPLSFHLWVRQRGFDEFPNAKLPEEKPPAPVRRLMQGAELEGLAVSVRIAERRELRMVVDPQAGIGVWTFDPVQPDLIAMASIPAPEEWIFVEEGSGPFGAWRERFKLWLHSVDVAAERFWLEPFDQNVHGLPAMHPNFKLRKAKFGFRVPALWPPRRDGSWQSGESA